jgi:hypothetical protein
MNRKVTHALTQLAAAAQELFQLEYLAYADPGEPNVVSELFSLLRPRFPQHTVSNEYDRREQEIKRLGTSKIVPDLIVHHVGGQDDNVLVVEVKLAGNYNYKGDVRKLSGMTDLEGAYRYAVGVHPALNVPHGRVNRAHVYIDGHVDRDLTTWFEAQFA